MQEAKKPDIEELLRKLSTEVIFVRSYAEQFETLYLQKNADSDRIDLEVMNEIDNVFFVLHREMLRDYVIQQLCNLTDAKSSQVRGKSRENLTLKLLLSRVKLISPNESTKLEIASIEIHNLVADLRSHRNRRIDHNDLLTMLKQNRKELPDIVLDQQEELPAIDRTRIPELLDKISEFLDEAHRICDLKSTVPHHHPIGASNGIDLLDSLHELHTRRKLEFDAI